MTHLMIKNAVIAFLAATALLAPLLSTSSAHAGGRGKEYFSETYTFAKPMNGFEGRAGDYYCSYIKTPVRKCDATGANCRIVAWQLEQRCQ